MKKLLKILAQVLVGLLSKKGTGTAGLVWEHGTLLANLGPLKPKRFPYSSGRSCKMQSYLPSHRKQ